MRLWSFKIIGFDIDSRKPKDNFSTLRISLSLSLLFYIEHLDRILF